MMELENSSLPSNAMEPLLRIILENSVDILMPLDRQGAILYAPTLVKDMLGYRPEELSGKNVIDIIHSDDHPAWKAALKQTLGSRGNNITVVSPCMLHNDGEPTGARASAWPSAKKLLNAMARQHLGRI